MAAVVTAFPSRPRIGKAGPASVLPAGRDERYAAGKTLRQKVPREKHGEWTAPEKHSPPQAHERIAQRVRQPDSENEIEPELMVERPGGVDVRIAKGQAEPPNLDGDGLSRQFPTRPSERRGHAGILGEIAACATFHIPWISHPFRRVTMERGGTQ